MNLNMNAKMLILTIISSKSSWTTQKYTLNVRSARKSFDNLSIFL